MPSMYTLETLIEEINMNRILKLQRLIPDLGEGLFVQSTSSSTAFCCDPDRS